MGRVHMGTGAAQAAKVALEWKAEYRRIAQTIGLDKLGVDYPTERLQRIYHEAQLQMATAQIDTIEKGFATIVEAIKARRQ